jgi:ABC-type Zn uptake system ZnuABC Zn-binding protein ZnuA
LKEVIGMKKYLIFLMSLSVAFAYILVSVQPLKLIVKEIYPGEVRILIDPNINPHTYQLTPSSMKNIADSDILIVFGSGFEEWMKRIEGKKICELSDILGAEAYQNAHVWLDPVFVIGMTVKAEKCLEEVYPDEKEVMREKLLEFLSKLLKETEEISKDLSSLKGTLLELRPALYHFVKRFLNVEYVTLVSQSQPSLSPRKLKEVLKICKRDSVKAILVERNSSKKIADPVVRECKLKEIVVDVLGTEASSYFELLEKIKESVKEALR